MELDQARRQAKDFNKRIEEIVDSVLGKDPALRTEPRGFREYHHSPKFRIVGVTRRIDDLVISSYTEKVSGIGARNVVLYHDFGSPPGYYGRALGVESVNDLWVCLYTDSQTLPEVEKLFTEGEHSEAEVEQGLNIKFFCGTNFAFDRLGRFGKLVAVPSWIQDDRPVVDQMRIYRNTIATMEPGNFEIVDIILDELKEKLSV